MSAYKVKPIKIITIILIILINCVANYAAVVSDNDGSAFVTNLLSVELIQ